VRQQVGPEKLRQLAAEMILELSSLTDDLADEEARPLISWGLDQADAAADAVVNSQRISVANLIPALPPDDLREALAGRVAPVRRVMKAISALVADRRELKPQELVERLEQLRALAGDLPARPAATISDTALAELAARQTDANNAALVETLLALLEPEYELRKQKQNQERGLE
jgi:predicted RecB family endonuclease